MAQAHSGRPHNIQENNEIRLRIFARRLYPATRPRRTNRQGTWLARPRAHIGRDIKMAVPPPSIKVAPPSTSATLSLQWQGSGCSDSGGGLSSKRPASSGPASTSPAKKKRASRSAHAKKKRAFTSPYHEFCQERRPFVPAGA
eukprot:scaffold90383_cov64-Phaeocystis_antarctica.AAC.1